MSKLFAIGVLVFFIIIGVVIFIGAKKKWRFFMEPFTPLPPLINTSIFIKKHTGTEGLRIYLCVVAFFIILFSCVFIYFIVATSNSENKPSKKFQPKDSMEDVNRFFRISIPN